MGYILAGVSAALVVSPLIVVSHISMEQSMVTGFTVGLCVGAAYIFGQAKGIRGN